MKKKNIDTITPKFNIGDMVWVRADKTFYREMKKTASLMKSDKIAVSYTSLEGPFKIISIETSKPAEELIYKYNLEHAGLANEDKIHLTLSELENKKTDIDDILNKCSEQMAIS